MTTEALLFALEELGGDDFESFKWHLQQKDSLKGHRTISKRKLEKAERRDTVDLMVQTYTLSKAVEVTKNILKKINRNDLVQSLSDSSSGAEVDNSGVGSSPSETPAPDLQTDGSAPSLFSARKSKSSLRALDLSHNRPSNSALKLLDEPEDPSWNLDPLSPIKVGGTSLSSVLTSNPSHMSELDLRFNDLRDSGLNLLSDGLDNSDWRLGSLRVDHGGEQSLKSGMRKWTSDLTLDTNTMNRTSKVSNKRKMTPLDLFTSKLRRTKH